MSILDQYDQNGNLEIGPEELNQAVRDKLTGDITAEELKTVKRGYLTNPTTVERDEQGRRVSDGIGMRSILVVGAVIAILYGVLS